MRDDEGPGQHHKAGLERLDQSERRAIVVPDDEQLLLHTVWVGEAYGPGTVDQLVAGLKRIGIADAL